MLVVGSPNSSNSNRLKEIAQKLGKAAYLIDGAEDIQKEWLDNVSQVGVTAGASAPEVLVEEVLEQLKEWGIRGVKQIEGREEDIVFYLPKALQDPSAV